MSTFHLISFGCRASQSDGAAIKKQLIAGGLAESSAETSDVAVLNTCTVTAAADAEARQIIRRIHRANPGCRILVTGCYAQWASEEIAKLPGVAWVVGNSHKHHVAEILLRGSQDATTAPRESPVWPEHVPNAPVALPPASETLLKISPPQPLKAEVFVGAIEDAFHFAPVFADNRTRPTLKVQDGCNARCSFCIIPGVRGPSRSLEPARVIEQVRALEQEGYREIVLSGINLGSYGRDLEPRLSFMALLERILLETSIPRLRISSIEPMDVSAELIRLVAQEPRMAKHFHVPLQSGSDRILRLMNRRYWTSQYAERLLAIREQMPHCGIGADVMAGFPGETEADHAQSLRFIDSMPFTYLHIFPYSARPGTPAASRPNAVDGRRMHERVREMTALIAVKSDAFLHAQIGRKLSVLTLHKRSDGISSALSSNYLKVSLPKLDVLPNTLLEVEIGRACGDHLIAYRPK